MMNTNKKMAIKYTLSGADAHQQYLKIEAEIDWGNCLNQCL